MNMNRAPIVPGRLVLAVLTLSIALWAAMVFGTLAHLRQLAGGLDPFDVRPFGYGVGAARVLLDALGDAGRDFYARVQLRIDAVYPATYALSRGLLLWWLTERDRLRAGRVPIAMRVLLLALPIAAAAFDYAENLQISRMLAAGSGVDSAVIETASQMTLLKSLISSATETCVVVLAVIAGLRWRQRHHS
jgi:hypothetical protein